MVISFVLSLRLVGSFFSDKKRSLLKGNKGVRRHKGCLSTPHRADKREKISARANYNRGDERDRGRQKRKKIPLFSHLRGGAEVNSLPRNSILHTETREDEEAINRLNIWKTSHSQMKVPVALSEVVRVRSSRHLWGILMRWRQTEAENGGGREHFL